MNFPEGQDKRESIYERNGMLKKDVLVVGGGISGITSAIEIGETGYQALILDKNPYLGGRVVQLNKYFPKLCPPACGVEINLRRMRANPNISFLTLAEVEEIKEKGNGFNVAIRINPRYVKDNCTGCGECVSLCPVEREDDFNLSLNKTKAIHLPYNQAFPLRYVIDDKVCSRCGECVSACKYSAIELDMQPKTIEIEVSSIIWATGWKPYEAEKIENLGFGRIKNVITNMMMERIASFNGPTQGKITRPSDGKPPERIAFVQCAGSRDENHLPYCSYICCMASLKQITYIKEQNPNAEIYLFYIDIRTPGIFYERFYNKIEDEKNVHLIKGKVGKISEDKTGDVILEAEDVEVGSKVKVKVDMAVLAVGMQPSIKGVRSQGSGVRGQDGMGIFSCNNDGFIIHSSLKKGVYAAGVAENPMDVTRATRKATSSAMKAIQWIRR
ncbi:MAG: CoB--CoM heterodisulfide reductase iron-sulfur subunit A family protein [bacterium]